MGLLLMASNKTRVDVNYQKLAIRNGFKYVREFVTYKGIFRENREAISPWQLKFVLVKLY